jgi:ubiquinone/menaquinone biosynthesis C-methylase UbiE
MDINVLEYRKRILDKISARLSLTGQEIAVDVGCGNGGDCAILLQNVKEVVGLDIELNSNWQKIANGKIEFTVADACNLPFPEESFELAFEKDVLHHVEPPMAALRELLRVTKTGGHIVSIEGNRYNPIFYFHMTLMEGHEHFNKTFFTELMRTYSKHVDFLSVESRVYPTKSRYLLKLLHHFEDLVEAIPFLRNFLCYNIAIIEKL